MHWKHAHFAILAYPAVLVAADSRPCLNTMLAFPQHLEKHTDLTHLLGNSLDSQPTCCDCCCGGGACATGHLAASISKAPLPTVAGRWVPAIAVMLMTLPPPLLNGMRLPSTAAPRRAPLFARRVWPMAVPSRLERADAGPSPSPPAEERPCLQALLRTFSRDYPSVCVRTLVALIFPPLGSHARQALRCSAAEDNQSLFGWSQRAGDQMRVYITKCPQPYT